MNSLLRNLIDWKDFELFVRDLYAQDQKLSVEHNVTLTGKSGARRQVDVLIKADVQFHKIVVLAECKRWKEKVDRARVDILAASIDDLGASKGAIFTTTGYEPGAKDYAKAKNIDIFVVRELTPDEWGAPGRVIHFYIHTCVSKLANFQLPDAKLLPVVERFPPGINLDIHISKDQVYPDDLYLYSVVDGERGPHLISVLLDKQIAALEAVGQSVQLFADGKDAKLLVKTPFTIDFRSYQFRQLRFKYGCVTIDTLRATLLSHISQSVFHFDRASSFDFAAVVEDFVTSRQTIVAKRKGESALEVQVQLEDSIAERARDSEPMVNGSILKVYLAPYVSFDLTGDETIAISSPVNLTLSEAG